MTNVANLGAYVLKLHFFDGPHCTPAQIGVTFGMEECNSVLYITPCVQQFTRGV